MSWFYLGEKKDNESRMTYRVVHQFDQIKEIGNPMAGQPIQAIRIPQMTVDMETKNRDEARRRVAYLNGGGSTLEKTGSDDWSESSDRGEAW